MDSVNVLVRELLPIEIEYTRRAGGDVSIQAYRSRFPEVDEAWLAAVERND